MRIIIFLLAFSMLLFSVPSSVNADYKLCGLTSDCESTSRTETDTSIEQINEHTTEEFKAQRIWWVSIVWEDNILPAMMLMAEQLSAVAVQQTQIIGQFFDAKHQMETQQVLQTYNARANKDYQPSTGLCEFGSSVKSLAASERLGEINAIALSQRSMDRALGNANTAAAQGALTDSLSRLKQFREVYCNPDDNNAGLDFICDHDQEKFSGQKVGGEDPARFNKDIDYLATIDAPWTLDVNLVDGGSSPKPDEEDIFALATNLYNHEILQRPTNLGGVFDDPELAYMNARAILAKRSVAENSYNAIVGMKSAGTAGSRDFLQAILVELGIDDANANIKTSAGASVGTPATALDVLLGQNPSYDAQMKVLTKKIYQNPDFYTNLYDKPANVERKAVALQAVGLMQKFDSLKSNLRNEATQSILLELAIIDLQNEIESQGE